MKPIVIIGAGGGGRFTHDICMANGVEVAAFLDDNMPKGTVLNGLPVLGGLTTLDEPGFCAQFQMLICVANFALRRSLHTKIKTNGGSFANAIHPSVQISPSAKIGEHVIINAYSIVHSNASIGDLTVVEGHSSIGTDNEIGDNVLFATGVMLNGRVVIEDDVFLGSGAIVIPDRRIGRGSYLGAGATATQDIPPYSLAVGVPATVIKPSPHGESIKDV